MAEPEATDLPSAEGFSSLAEPLLCSWVSLSGVPTTREVRLPLVLCLILHTGIHGLLTFCPLCSGKTACPFYTLHSHAGCTPGMHEDSRDTGPPATTTGCQQLVFMPERDTVHLALVHTASGRPLGSLTSTRSTVCNANAWILTWL